MKRLFLCSSFADVANLFVDCAKEDLRHGSYEKSVIYWK